MKQSNFFSLYLLVDAKKIASEIDMATRPVMLMENNVAKLVTKVPSWCLALAYHDRYEREECCRKLPVIINTE